MGRWSFGYQTQFLFTSKYTYWSPRDSRGCVVAVSTADRYQKFAYQRGGKSGWKSSSPRRSNQKEEEHLENLESRIKELIEICLGKIHLVAAARDSLSLRCRILTLNSLDRQKKTQGT